MRRILTIVVCSIVALFVSGCEVDVVRIESNAYINKPEIKGDSKNCAVVLRAQQGISYSITLYPTDEGVEWAHFSGGATTIDGKMESTDKVVFVYFSQNSSGSPRKAAARVEFSDGAEFTLFFTQLSFDDSIAMERAWAELPVCTTDDDYIYNTHYGKLGIKNNARNYSYCFDSSVRASLWAAYPLHSSHMTGDGNRNYSEFGYDPLVDDGVQANLYRSYNGWYDRGHQIPAADRKCSQEMMDQTFYSTNMTPQQGNFNQNKWGVLEGRVRSMVCSDTLYVVTGAYFGGNHDSSIDKQTTDRSGNVCPTPTYYYKALLRTKKGNTGKRIDEIEDASQVRAIAFWLKHANTGEDTSITSTDCISIKELEDITGFDFFPMLDDAIEVEVEATAVPSEWGIN